MREEEFERLFTVRNVIEMIFTETLISFITLEHGHVIWKRERKTKKENTGWMKSHECNLSTGGSEKYERK